MSVAPGMTIHAAAFRRSAGESPAPPGGGNAPASGSGMRERTGNFGRGAAATSAEQTTGASAVALLVQRAADGDQWAWERLVDQYARLIWAMTRDFKLAESDAADVFQAAWLRLLEHIDRIEYPARVGSWLAATARHECLRSLAAQKRVVLIHDDMILKDEHANTPEIDERLLAEERAQAVREALSHLPRHWRRLVELLMADPPASYTEISDQLGLPVGSIGPTRGRCMARLGVLLQHPEPPVPAPPEFPQGRRAPTRRAPTPGQPAAPGREPIRSC